MNNWQDLEHLFGLKLLQEQRRQTEEYLALLEKWNSKINLVGNLGRDELLRFHFFESFWVAEHFLDEGSLVADIGSGAGFPGLAAKIWRPRLRVVLIEPNLKKSVFLREAARLLGAEVEVFPDRAEVYPGLRDLDWALVRALRPSKKLLRLLGELEVPLIVLHGPDWELPVRAEIARTLKVPGSRGRFASVVRGPICST